MLQRGIRLGKILGIEIGLDYSWFLIFGLVTFTLSDEFIHMFPEWGSQYSVWGDSVYWVVGLITSLLFFSSVLAHEMGHSIVAIRTGLPVQSITLFLFGGVARIVREPSKPLQEFVIAIAGPLVSVALGVLFWLLAITAQPNTPVQTLADYLSYINFALAIFNMIPGFPLDGGRVLRAILWKTTGSVFKATKIASWSGRIVGLLFIAAGLTIFIWTEYRISGLWLALIGWFLHNTAMSSLQQSRQRQILSTHHVRDLIHDGLPQVSPEIPVQELVNEFFLKRGCHSIRVVRNEQLLGLITLQDVRRTPKAAWAMTAAGSVMTPIHLIPSISADETLLALYDQMIGLGLGQVVVVHEHQVIGVITRGQLMELLRIYSELGLG